MLNHIGLSGILFLIFIIGLPIILTIRSNKRKAQELEQIVDIFEESSKTPTHRQPRPPRVYVQPKRSTGEQKPARNPTTKSIKGKCYVIDGDTISISGTRIRLAGIDAPELDHPWGKKSKITLISMCKGKTITAQFKDEISYDRIVATCF